MHFSHRAPWLRAFILGANDGLVSVASLIVGVSGGSTELRAMQLAGVAGLVGGALSMACGAFLVVVCLYCLGGCCLSSRPSLNSRKHTHKKNTKKTPKKGEFISVASQKDAEEADIAKERAEQEKGPEARARELEELALIYMSRGLSDGLARAVAEELSAKDVIRAHARDELGIDVDDLANPLQASVVSAIAFSLGAAMPLLAGAFVTDFALRTGLVCGVTAIALVAFGGVGAWLGDANVFKGGARVLVGGSLAMAITYGIGRAFGGAVAA